MPVDKIKTVVTFTTVKILKEEEKNLISYPELSIKNIKVSKGKKNVRKSLDHFKAKKSECISFVFVDSCDDHKPKMSRVNRFLQEHWPQNNKN